jgi:hypothetical protein
MINPETAAICHWLTPTRLMPHPYGVDQDARPWSCVRDGSPRPLTSNELHECATCPRWEVRTFEAKRRDLVFEAWGIGIPIPEPTAFEDVKRRLVSEAWGVRGE